MQKIKDNFVYQLFKRGKEAHIKALYETGELYLSTIEYIRKADSNTDRTDKHDGFAFRKYLGKAKLTIAATKKELDKNGITFDTDNAFIVYDGEHLGNIYCLTGIFTNEFSGQRNDIEYDTKSFGEDLIHIKYPEIFLERVLKGLSDLGYNNVIHEKVEYYKNDYSGELGLFKKHEKFEAQKEFRIFVPNENNQPIKLKIGSLKDIATVKKSVLLNVIYGDGKIQNISF